MTTPGRGPTVVRRQLGRRLRELRVKAGKSVDDVITAHVASRTKLWRIESGRTVVKLGDVLVMARLYEVGRSALDELVALAEASATSGYVEEHREGLPERMSLYADLEASASALSTYNCELVPGLLQTEDYIRAVMAADPTMSGEEARRRTAFRRHRQRVFLDRPEPARLDVVITEGALRVLVGSPTVMQAQVAHLRAVATGDSVSVRVLPFERGLHRTMQGPYTILDFADPDDPDVVYLESFVGGRYVEKPGHVARLRAFFGEVRARAVPIGEFRYG